MSDMIVGESKMHEVELVIDILDDRLVDCGVMTSLLEVKSGSQD